MAIRRGRRIVVVTGGTGAIGSAVAEAFVDGGDRVVISTTEASHATGLSRRLRARIDVIAANLSDEAGVRGLYQTVEKMHGRVDVVVNTVGGYVPAAFLEKVRVEDWEKMIRLNLTTTFLSTREAIRHMRPRRKGWIVNFSAKSALHPLPGRIPYAISKAGVALLTQLAAEEVRGSGIVITAVAPGAVNTPANRTWGSPAEVRRWVTPEEIAATVVFLSSSEAAPLTGSVLEPGDRP